MFGWFALLFMLAAGIGLDYWRFRKNHPEENADEPSDLSGWLAARAAALTGPGRLESAADFIQRRIIQPYPGWWKWAAGARESKKNPAGKEPKSRRSTLRRRIRQVLPWLKVRLMPKVRGSLTNCGPCAVQ